jgi:hypothetical protein
MYPEYDPSHKTRNLTIGIHNLVEWLSNGRYGDDYLDSYIYDYIQNRLYPGMPEVAQSYALRLLIHYVGDIHQPFHCEDRYDETYPDGDKGANSFDLKYHYGADELHAVWDIVLYSQHNNIARPFTEETWLDFQPQVIDMDERNKDSIGDASNYENVDFDTWADESYDIAITLYDGLTAGEDEVVPQSYIDEKLPIAESRITLGGYRLAYLMSYIYPDTQQTFLA